MTSPPHPIALAEGAAPAAAPLDWTGWQTRSGLAGGLGGAVGRLRQRGGFRGPGEYRRMLAGVLARRALEEVGS